MSQLWRRGPFLGQLKELDLLWSTSPAVGVAVMTNCGGFRRVVTLAEELYDVTDQRNPWSSVYADVGVVTAICRRRDVRVRAATLLRHGPHSRRQPGIRLRAWTVASFDV